MNRLRTWLRSEWGQMAILVLLMLAGRSSLADHYFVPSGSMEYTLMPGDRVIVDKTAYGIRIPFTKIDVIERDEPQRGDIAVFDSPDDDTLLIKRIVAVGGDRVDLVNGHLSINGTPVAGASTPNLERFGDRVARLNLEHGGGANVSGLRLPANTVLAVGDHRGNSRDGRYFGLVHKRELYGRAVAVYYSRDERFTWKRL